MNEVASNQPFFLKNCALTAIATGQRASSLMELRDKLAVVDESCLFYHFWGSRMYPHFIHSQHHNDFSNWAYHRLHDHVLSERLSIIDPIEFENLEALRQEVLEIIENRLDEYEIMHYTKRDDQFNFISSSIIVFETSFVLSTPEDLKNAVPLIPPGSIFYHFIDARARTPERTDDFSLWLKNFGEKYQLLIEKTCAIDPYFLSLTELKDELTKVVTEYFEGESKHE